MDTDTFAGFEVSLQKPGVARIEFNGWLSEYA